MIPGSEDDGVSLQSKYLFLKTYIWARYDEL
jgi:hypothetical protein